MVEDLLNVTQRWKDIDVPGLGFERETNSTTDNGIDVGETNVVEFDDTTTISPSESTNSHTPAEDASQNEVSELDEPEIMLGNGPVDNHYRGYDVFEEHDWVRITNNPQSGNSEPALVDIDRQNLITRDIAQTYKRLYREAVDTKWEEAVKKACRFRNSIGRNDQYIAFSNGLISLIDSHIKKFENPRARQR